VVVNIQAVQLMLLMLYYSSWQLSYTCTLVSCTLTLRLVLLPFIGLHMEIDCIVRSRFIGPNCHDCAKEDAEEVK
jgi:hypothetical protein